MDDYRAYICPDCGGQVRGLGLCREHDPPGHPVETMMVPKAEVIVLRERLRRAVDALRTIAASESWQGVVAANALADLGIGDPLLSATPPSSRLSMEDHDGDR